MNKYRVTYPYLATGMEGKANTKNYGIVSANTAQDAVDMIGFRCNPGEPNKAHRNWGLSAELVSRAPDVISRMKCLASGVNELSELQNFSMNKVTITSIPEATTVVKDRRFIVGSVSSATGVSFASSPAVHNTAKEARTECARLARLNPGKLFVFVQLCGAEMVPTDTFSI